MESGGRILRAQASRKHVFQTILPLLSEGLIRPAEGKRPARKDHAQIKEHVRALRAQIHKVGEDADAFMAMTNLIEQACNRYLQTGEFPTTYEEIQPPPVLSVGHLTFAGDDGMKAGQTYRARVEMAHFYDLQTRQEHQQASISLRLRTPDSLGKWAWGAWSEAIPLPPTVFTYLWQGATTQAPTLREIRGDDGSRVVVLDLILEVRAQYVTPLEHERRVAGFDWGVRSLITVSILEKPEGDEPYRQISRPVFLDTGGIDGRQARLRREIDRLCACRDRYAQFVKQALAARDEHGVPLPAHFAGWQRRANDYKTRIKQCWKTYERRNRELAHLASNLLILLALVYDCRLICGENLTTLKTEGRGRGVRGRFRNWRNNTTVRGELWRTLTYKCHLLGIRARQVEPRWTTHTCPHCHQPAKTYASSAPADRKKARSWGPWLCCSNPDCLWNGARDYAASVNIARLGMAYLVTYQETKRYVAYRMADSSVKPATAIAAQARRCCCRRRGLHPALLQANTSTMLAGRIPPHYAHLDREISLRCFLRPKSESTCSNMRNGRIISCFCNGRIAKIKIERRRCLLIWGTRPGSLDFLSEAILTDILHSLMMFLTTNRRCDCMAYQPFKPLLLDLLRQAQSSQNAFFQLLPAEELVMSGTPDFWSAKDHVAHMAFWRQRLALRLQAIIGKEPQPEAQDFEQMNPLIFEEQRYRPWSAILSESDQAYADLIMLSAQLTEEDLTAWGRFDWVGEGMPLYTSYMGNCYEHTQNHLAQYLLDRHEDTRALEIYEVWTSRVVEATIPETLKGYMLYNLACFYATHDQLEKVRPALQQAFTLYPALKEFALTDPDLFALRPQN